MDRAEGSWVWITHLLSGLVYTTFRTHHGPIASLTFSHENNGEGGFLTVGSPDNRASIWDVRTISPDGRLLPVQVLDHASAVLSVTFSHHGSVALDANPANRATGHPSPVPCYQGIFFIFYCYFCLREFMFFKKNNKKLNFLSVFSFFLSLFLSFTHFGFI